MKEFVPAGERKIIDQCIDEERKHLVRLKQMMPV
jgi:rubrerythrin